jgi:hypothetical protein
MWWRNDWIFDHFSAKISFKFKPKIIEELGMFLLLLEIPLWIGFNEGDLGFLQLRCRRYWILNSFIFGNSIKSQKTVLEGKSHWIINLHLGQQHKLG